MTKFYSGILFSVVALVLFSCAKKEKYESYFPETGKAAIYHRSLDLQSNLNVLSLALEPGYEDLAALAYFRLGRGATVLSAYLTNGEAGENDVKMEYPNYVAATRRLEASDALIYLGGDVHFLCFPHIVAARDSAKIRKLWPQKQMRSKLKKLINESQPDIILIARDWAGDATSLRWQIFKKDLLAVVREMGEEVAEQGKDADWKVSRVLLDDFGKSGQPLPVDDEDPQFGKRYRKIGLEAGEKYQSLSVQRPAWMQGKKITYKIVYPEKTPKFVAPDENLPPGNSNQLGKLAQQVKDLSENILHRGKDVSLQKLVAILRSVNLKLGTRFSLPDKDQRTLFHWKEKLEELQCSLLGIRINYSIDFHVLTAVQLAKIVVEDFAGFKNEKNTTVYFGGLGQKWIINEGMNKKAVFRRGEVYSIISPKELNLTAPQGKYGLQSARVDKPITLYTIHEAKDKEHSFIHRSVIRLKFSPKLSIEILTPIVRVVPGEKIIVRLTNHSRDGIRDTVMVKADTVESIPGRFRLNQKEATYLDSLTLIWLKFPAVGTYKFPVNIGGVPLANFAARSFPVEVDTTKKVGVLSGIKGNPVEVTLRRMELKYIKLDPRKNISRQMSDLDVVIVDRRALSLDKDILGEKNTLAEFVKRGGHLIFLAQDAAVWNNSGIWEDVSLRPSQKFDESYPVNYDKTHPFFTTPNPISEVDWQSWLYLRAYNVVEAADTSGLSIPVRAKGQNSPLLLTKEEGKGRITYIDLALSQQFLNIHPGMFRLFANIISY